jgi:ABC-type multidrug transport system fused ATPase/permease subunit
VSAPAPTTLRRGLALSPELRRGLAGTVVLALLAALGKVAIPVAVQLGMDRGLRVPGGPDLGALGLVVGATVVLLGLTVACSYWMNVRLYTVSETALSGLRTRTFRHIHDLSMLHQQAQRRGSLVSRVTSDIDQISMFLQWGGVVLLVSTAQLVVTATVMFVYSWQLTLLAIAAFVPLALSVRWFQRRLQVAYGEVRERVGAMLSAIAESVVGAPVIRAYGVGGRTGQRLDRAIEANRKAQIRAQLSSVTAFSLAELASGIALAAVVVAGVHLGAGGHLSVGQLAAFLLLVALFIQPVQSATEVLNEAQNAAAGWRRVLEVASLEPDVADPGAAGVDLPAGPLSVGFHEVGFAYPGGAEVLRDVDLTIAPGRRVAVVGETGSGKTTFAKLLTRLMDPGRGQVRLADVPLTTVSFASLRRRVVMVPQDGFLFDDTIAANVRYAVPELTPAQLEQAFTDLGLADWVAGLPDGLATRVGERGEALSVGERQLVALARAYVADPDLLVLDEATSAVDPATEVRLQRTLDTVTRGRTTIAIAHRLSTAQAADEVVVVDRGVVVQRGPHAELIAEVDSIYAKLYASWLEQTR